MSIEKPGWLKVKIIRADVALSSGLQPKRTLGNIIASDHAIRPITNLLEA